MKSGLRVALVTDGRLSGASGKVPAVIHLSPEAQRGGPLCRINDGDVIRVDAQAGRIDVQTDLSARPETHPELAPEHLGSGRELFSAFRQMVSSAEQGASIFSF